MHKSRQYTYSIRDALVLTIAVAIGTALLILLIRHDVDTGPARVVVCKNNLSQLAKATAGYERRCRQFPGYNQSLAGREAPWAVALLPQVDRLDLAELWNDPRIDPTTRPDIRPYMELFVCPHDRPTAVSGPCLSYVANAGIADADNLNLANGVFVDLTRSAGVSQDDLVDGASYTLLFSENLQATTWDAPGKRETVFLWHPTVHPTKAMRINGGQLNGPLSAQTARPSSRHRGGVNAAFADTHVQFLSEDIDYKVYVQLMTADGRASDMPAAWKDFAPREGDDY